MTSHHSPDPDDLNFSALPPTELLSEWETDILYEYQNIDITLLKAYQAGADAELEACCEWLRSSLPGYDKHYADYLHTARRPKPPSLKERALQTLQKLSVSDYPCNYQGNEDWDTIRRALEQLDD